VGALSTAISLMERGFTDACAHIRGLLAQAAEARGSGHVAAVLERIEKAQMLLDKDPASSRQKKKKKKKSKKKISEKTTA
jgi:hypothetical protein